MTKSRHIRLSLIIPAYNETTRLVSGLYLVLSYLTKQHYSWELILVDDGSQTPVTRLLSSSSTKKILHFPLRKLPVSVIRQPKNQGKGTAIARGVESAKGDCIVFCDADQSVPIGHLKTLLQLLRTHDMVIASRRVSGAKIAVHQSWSRETAGRFFTALSNILCATGVADVTCGFKGFRRETARMLFEKSKIARWVFDTEIVFLARKYGINIAEMPVTWSNKAGSKVSLVDNIGSLVDLFRIRWFDMTGVYNR